MLKNIFPHEFVESVFSIDYNKVFKMGYRAIIFDIDATLVPHGAGSTTEIDELFKEIQSIGLKTVLLSNNSEKRIAEFTANIDTLYISEANKPEISGYMKAIELLEVKNTEVLMVGDQLFTDVLGANRSNIKSVLVKFLCHAHETKIGKKRQVERIILKIYRMRKSYCNRIGDIHKEEI